MDRDTPFAEPSATDVSGPTTRSSQSTAADRPIGWTLSGSPAGDALMSQIAPIDHERSAVDCSRQPMTSISVFAAAEKAGLRPSYSQGMPPISLRPFAQQTRQISKTICRAPLRQIVLCICSFSGTKRPTRTVPSPKGIIAVSKSGADDD